MAVAIVAATAIAATSIQAIAAPIRYEAENATISQGVVESNHTGFTGTGFVNYDNVIGSYVEYTVNAAQAGEATLTFRFANGGTTNRPLDITVNGALAADELAFAPTGAWTTWQTVTTKANLTAGTNKIRATATTANGGPNADSLDVTVAAPNTDYQAESATISQGVVESNHTGFTGTGFVNYDNVIGSYVEFTVNAAAAGAATLTFRYSNGTTTNRPMDITVNGTLAADELAFAGTSTWDTWQTTSVQTTLNAGTNKIRATATTASGGPNLDKLSASISGPPDVEPPSAPANLRSTGSTCTSATLTWDVSNDDNGVVGYRVSRNGTVVTTVPQPPATISGLTQNTSYSFTVTAVDAAGNVSAPSNAISVTTPSCPVGRTPVEINGQLHVCGVKLCNQYNKPIQLRGMSTHGIQWYSQCIKTASLDALANDWKADILRISMYIQEDGYETDPRKFTDMVHGYIEEATKRGMYALVDWHQLDPGDPNYNLSRAKTFFTEIAQRHKDKVNIIYDIANEPNGVSWSGIKSYAEQLIPVIRAQDPDSVVFLGTHGWASLGVSDGRNETDIINNPVNATNIMYTFHFYAASHHDEYFNALSRAADRIPIFVTEFGTQTYTGDGGNDFTYSQKYLDFLASKKIGWTNWNFSDDFRSGAVFKTGTCSGSTFAGTGVLKPAGVWVRERTMTPDDFPTS
ncbi:cellulase family glycosylhydrolase [Lentzea sp. NBRC 105346]|uniref:cellulase family glycosylhydrolase n=1 Tax=Lentzea sp. NBRC 105346 TaxID=3032205 RepID=UPI002553C4DA|nr:cellulase family glycosylhydrolase [Lentzea sp. NBRC 105346]